MTTIITTTKDNLALALLAEFGSTPDEYAADVTTALEDVLATVTRHRGDCIHYDAFLDLEVRATA